MMKPMRWLLVLLLLACGTAASTSTPRDTLDSLPHAASAALRRLAAGAKIEHVERAGDTYQGTWHVAGLKREATVTASGELVELEEEVSSTQVPAAVRAAAIIELPDAQSIRFVNFEAEAIVDGKQHIEKAFAPDGRRVSDDDD